MLFRSGATFDSIAEIERYADLIERQTVAMRIMPPGNITRMTEAEREVIARWFAARATTADASGDSMAEDQPAR